MTDTTTRDEFSQLHDTLFSGMPDEVADALNKLYPLPEHLPSNDTVAVNGQEAELTELFNMARLTATIHYFDDPALSGIANVVVELVNALRAERYAAETGEAA